jgi:hypothetical protein
MTNLFDLGRRSLALLLLITLVACGPGSGGTGTGPVTFSGAGQVTSVTDGSATPSSGTGGDCGPCTQVDLKLDDALVELTTPCSHFIYEGPWLQDASGAAVVTGRYQTPSGATVVATLRLQFAGSADSSPQVTVTVLDESGQVLAGPLTVQRQVAGQPQPVTGTCP